MIGVGTLSTGVTAEVDADGTVHRGPLRFHWRVRSGNDWLVPGRDAPTRQSRPHAAPMVHTAVRIPGGDAISRVYAIGDGDTATVVIDVENASPEAIAVGFVVASPGELAVDDYGARVDGARVLAFARRPGAVETDNGFVFPVPHRTKVRIALDIEVGCRGARACQISRRSPRSWDRILDRGLRTELPQPLQSEVDAARADLLLAAPSADAFAALEAWGFDEDAVEMWAHLTTRARRSAKGATFGGVLGDVRAALVREDGARAIDLLPGFRPAWLGQPLAVHGVPLRAGACSFALRWHGARPALLWDVPVGLTVRARSLDARWASNEPVGETLLGEPSTKLLAMGEGAAPSGTSVDAPEQFS